MPNYNCPRCPNPVAVNPALQRGQSVACPNGCGAFLTFKLRVIDFNPFGGMTFVAPKRRKGAPAAVVVAPGRSPAAPTRAAWPGVNLNANVTYVPNLMAGAWTGAGLDTIRLAYRDLTPGSGNLEGIIIDCPEALGRPSVQLHFAKVMMQLTSGKKPTDVAEATGEAAAALCILRQGNLAGGGVNLALAGFTMEWGMHLHSGAGIDQIWRNNHQYLIVEAKGPNQTLSLNHFMPPHFEQMSTRWIMHNLETMNRSGHTIARDILADLNVTTGTRWPNYQGAAKNYYGVNAVNGAATGQLYGVVVTAVWRPDGMLGFAYSNFRRYANPGY